MAKVFKRRAKPDNLIIIRSSMFINKAVKPGYWFVDKTFTVYDKEYIKANQVDINCGARDCINCLKCYTHNDKREIREKLK